MIIKLKPFLISACIYSALCDNFKSEYSPAFSIAFPYITAASEFPNFQFGLSTIIDSNESIVLTPDIPRQTGYVWSLDQFAWENWEFVFQFRITGDSKLYGDGFGFFLVKEPFAPGSCFGASPRFTGLALLFDTFPNSDKARKDFPQLQLAVGDGANRIPEYKHDTDGGDIVIARKPANIRNLATTTKAKLRYVHQKLEVFLSTDGTDKWEKVFKVDNLSLPKNLHAGFSAYTGQAKDMHEIINLIASEVKIDKEFYASTVAIQEEMTAQPRWIVWLVFGAVVAGIGFVVYRKRAGAAGDGAEMYDKVLNK